MRGGDLLCSFHRDVSQMLNVTNFSRVCMEMDLGEIS